VEQATYQNHLAELSAWRYNTTGHVALPDNQLYKAEVLDTAADTAPKPGEGNLPKFPSLSDTESDGSAKEKAGYDEFNDERSDSTSSSDGNAINKKVCVFVMSTDCMLVMLDLLFREQYFSHMYCMTRTHTRCSHLKLNRISCMPCLPSYIYMLPVSVPARARSVAALGNPLARSAAKLSHYVLCLAGRTHVA